MKTSLRKYSEQELLRMLDCDPHTGMAAMVEQYTGLLWHVAEHHLKNPEDIKECVNDTFLEFYIHRERFDSKKGTLATYLAQIMRNLSISRYRKNVLWDEQLDTPLEDPMSISELAEARVDLERAMAALKPEDAEIIRMKYYGGMTVREIAASLGLSYDTVKKRHQRSLSKMRMLLLGLLLLGGHGQGARQKRLHLFHRHRLVRWDELPAEQLRHADFQQLREGLEKGDVGQAQAPLPLGDGFVGDIQPLRQVLLGHASLLPQLDQEPAEFFFINVVHV